MVRARRLTVNGAGTMCRMKLYADGPSVAPVRWSATPCSCSGSLLWLKLADVVHDATLALAAPGRKMQEAGGGLADKLRDAGSAVGDVPWSATRCGPPSTGPAAADQIAAAGTAQVEAVQHLAFWLGITIGALPILLVALVYLPLRLRFVREAAAGQRLIDDQRRPRPVRAAGDVPPADAPAGEVSRRPGPGLA